MNEQLERPEFVLDQEVVVREDNEYYEDWRGSILKIVGITRSDRTGKIELELRDTNDNDWTDGWLQKDLEAYQNPNVKMRFVEVDIEKAEHELRELSLRCQDIEERLLYLKAKKGELMMEMGDLG